MSQIYKFDKLWKILDDCIKTNRYKQIRCRLSDDKDGRCINGVYISYALNHQPIKGKKTPELLQVFENILYPKYRYKPTDDALFDELMWIHDKEILVNRLKKDYENTGDIVHSYLAQLNNSGMSFEEIRDLLKEIDA